MPRSRRSTRSAGSSAAIRVVDAAKINSNVAQITATWLPRYQGLNATERRLIDTVVGEMARQLSEPVDNTLIAGATFIFFEHRDEFTAYLHQAFARRRVEEPDVEETVRLYEEMDAETRDQIALVATHMAQTGIEQWSARRWLALATQMFLNHPAMFQRGLQDAREEAFHRQAQQELPQAPQPEGHYLQLYEQADAATQAVIRESAAWVAVQVAPEGALAAAAFLYFDRNVVHTAPSAAAAQPEQPEDSAAAEQPEHKEPEPEGLGLVEYSAPEREEEPWSEPLQCLLPGCERVPVQLGCCNKLLCEGCILNCSKISGRGRIVLVCPFCRDQTHMSGRDGRRLLAQECPSHAKVMERVDGGQVVVAHLPRGGSYGADSILRFLDL